ncbi:MAG: hypothetical protein JKY25_03540 [Robiginitomaculum sp.]|nr:hypothetical protein [Robiginitomaculum sp.]
MKLRKALSWSAAILATSAIPAAAHTGTHTEALMSTILHWLTSPTHALLAVVGGIAVIALAVKLKNSRS